MRAKLEVIDGQLPDPPYPSDCLAKGFCLDLDTERLCNSDTYVLLDPAARAYWVFLFVVAWQRGRPCGSLPGDERVIEAHLGCGSPFFLSHRDNILRGWRKHSDGRLYHPVMTEHVLGMIEKRAGYAKRQSEFRQRLSSNVTRDYRETAALITDPTPTPTPTPTKRRNTLSSPSDLDAAKRLLAFLNEKAGRAYREVPSHLKMIQARVREHGEESLRAMVALKCREWKNDEKMAEYLRPGTLFNATKCADYVGRVGTFEEAK